MAPLSSLYVPPAMKRRQHADIALLDASQAEFDKLLLAECLPQPEPCNECCGGASSSVKISQLEVKKHFSLAQEAQCSWQSYRMLIPPVGNVSTHPSPGVINLNCLQCVGKSAITAP